MRQIQINAELRCPRFHAHVFQGIAVQGRDLYAGALRIVYARHVVGLHDDPGAVLRVKLPQLDKNRAALCRTRGVPGGGWVANVSARGVVAVLVLEDALQHQKFFAARVGVGTELAAWRITHDAGGLCHLVAYAVQHAPRHARHGRGLPVVLGGMDHGSLLQIGVQLHGVFLQVFGTRGWGVSKAMLWSKSATANSADSSAPSK